MEPRHTESRPPLRGEETWTIRLAAAALPLGILIVVVATVIHPHQRAPMDNPGVFAEYAGTEAWVAIHFAQWLGVLLVLAGLIGVYHAIRHGSALSAALARYGLAASVPAAAAFTALQAVDGVALKWAADGWVAASGDDKATLFAAAKSVRWTEYAFQSYSNILLGLALGLIGLAMALGSAYPRWLGAVAVASGLAWMLHGVMVPYVGLFDSTPRLVAMVLLATWGFATSYLMWRGTAARSAAGRRDVSGVGPAASVG